VPLVPRPFFKKQRYKGRMKNADGERLFNDKMGRDPIFCTDFHHSYVKFAQKYGLEHQRIKRVRHKK